MKKLCVFLLICALLASFLFSCQTPQPSASGSTPATESQAAVPSSTRSAVPSSTRKVPYTPVRRPSSQDREEAAKLWASLSEEEQIQQILEVEKYYKKPVGWLAEHLQKNGLGIDPHQKEYLSDVWVGFFESVPYDHLVEFPKGLSLPDSVVLTKKNGKQKEIEPDDPRLIRLLNLFNESLNTENNLITNCTRWWDLIETDDYYLPILKLQYSLENAYATEKGEFTTVIIRESGFYLLDPDQVHIEEEFHYESFPECGAHSFYDEHYPAESYSFYVEEHQPYGYQGSGHGETFVLWLLDLGF